MTKITKVDIALGGKIKCKGCGGEWWATSAQLAEYAKHGTPTKCGNHPDVPGTGSQDHCTHEGPMEFLPYDVEENIAGFRAKGMDEVADGLAARVEQIKKEVGE